MLEHLSDSVLYHIRWCSDVPGQQEPGKPELICGPKPLCYFPSNPVHKPSSTFQCPIQQKWSWAPAYSSEMLLTISSNKLFSFISYLKRVFLHLEQIYCPCFLKSIVLASKTTASSLFWISTSWAFLFRHLLLLLFSLRAVFCFYWSSHWLVLRSRICGLVFSLFSHIPFVSKSNSLLVSFIEECMPLYREIQFIFVAPIWNCATVPHWYKSATRAAYCRGKWDKAHLYLPFFCTGFKKNIKLNGHGLSWKCLGVDIQHVVRAGSSVLHEDDQLNEAVLSCSLVFQEGV